MRTLREWLLRLWGTARRRRADEDLEEELRLHVQLAADEARRRGQTPREAERAARVRAGNVSTALDALRDQRGLPWLDAAAADFGRLPRLVRQHRGYYAFAVLTLAMAVGVNLIVFTVVNALWLRPLPVPDDRGLVTFANTPWIGLTDLDSRILEPFAAVAGQVMTDDMSRQSDRQPQVALDGVERALEVLGVTATYFDVLGLALRGRGFTPQDDQPGAEPVVIISDRLWSQAFGRRTEIIGTVVPAQPFPLRIVGVAPPGFLGARRGERADAWIPSSLVLRTIPAGVASAQDGLVLMAFARLRDGQTPGDALRRIRETVDLDPRMMRDLVVVPLRDVFGSPATRTLVIREGNGLGVAGGLALLVLAGGCATLMALVSAEAARSRWSGWPETLFTGRSVGR